MIIAVRRPGRTVEVIFGCLIDDGYWTALACGIKIAYFVHYSDSFACGVAAPQLVERTGLEPVARFGFLDLRREPARPD